MRIIEPKKPLPAPGLYGLGIGPGDPELLTLKALRILQSSDRIFIPRSDEKNESLAKTAISDFLIDNPSAQLKLQEIDFPMIRDAEGLNVHWGKAAAAVAESYAEGSVLSFITLGDPCLYSTFYYLVKALSRQHGEIPIHVIPGVSSVSLASARLLIPLSLGNERISIVPLPKSIPDLKGTIDAADTIVVMKIGNRLQELIEYLSGTRLMENSSYVRRAGFTDEYILKDLSSLPKDERGYLSIVIIRKNIFP